MPFQAAGLSRLYGSPRSSLTGADLELRTIHVEEMGLPVAPAERPRLLTAAEAGRLLGVGAPRIRQMLRRGEIIATTNDAGQYMFDADEMRELARDRNAGRVRVARGSGRPVTSEDERVARLIAEALPRAIEAALADMRAELAAEKAARRKAERELARLRGQQHEAGRKPDRNGRE